MNDQIIELTKLELKKWLFAAWRNGGIGSGVDIEDDIDAFEEWYEDGKWIIDN